MKEFSCKSWVCLILPSYFTLDHHLSSSLNNEGLTHKRHFDWEAWWPFFKGVFSSLHSSSLFVLTYQSVWGEVIIMAMGLTNRLTHLQVPPLPETCQHPSTTHDHLQKGLIEKKPKFCVLLSAFVSPIEQQGHVWPLAVNKTVGTSRLQSGANKSCADSKQRVPAQSIVEGLIPPLQSSALC